jgi:hypothetical protein
MDARAQNAALTDADTAAILAAMNLTPNARGEVENECGEFITPKIEAVELGGPVGTAALLAMSGGPNTASCYGDGPGLTLFRRDGAAWSMIYSSRGAMLVVLPGSTNGARDLVEGGPGFEHPLYQWNGAEYAFVRSIADDAIGENVIYLPSE